MAQFAAFLRGVNVGGNRLLPMAELRALLAESGFPRVQTLLQSGNVVFESCSSPAEVETQIERLIEQRFRMTVETMARSKEDVEHLIARNPFPREAASDPGRLILFMSKAVLTSIELSSLRAAIKGPEKAEIAAGHLFIHYPGGQGQSKLTPQLIERAIGCRSTARNWNTILKVAALLTG